MPATPISMSSATAAHAGTAWRKDSINTVSPKRATADAVTTRPSRHRPATTPATGEQTTYGTMRAMATEASQASGKSRRVNSTAITTNGTPWPTEPAT